MKTLNRLLLCFVMVAVFLCGCGGEYEVYLAIGDGKVENDNVFCKYRIAESFTDNYKVKGWFSAESEADLNDSFVFSISFDDRYAGSFTEKTLFSFTGEQLKATNGKLNFEIDLGVLSEIFEKTDAQKDFAFHFHRERAERTDMIKWNESSYKYTFDGKTVKIEK